MGAVAANSTPGILWPFDAGLNGTLGWYPHHTTSALICYLRSMILRTSRVLSRRVYTFTHTHARYRYRSILTYPLSQPTN